MCSQVGLQADNQGCCRAEARPTNFQPGRL